MKILGISAHYHDSAAALVVDGVPVCAVQEERLSRHKNDAGFPDERHRMVPRPSAALEPADLDAVVFYERSMLKFERILTSALRTFPALVAIVSAGDQELARAKRSGCAASSRRTSACRGRRSCSPVTTRRTPPRRFSPRRRVARRS